MGLFAHMGPAALHHGLGTRTCQVGPKLRKATILQSKRHIVDVSVWGVLAAHPGRRCASRPVGFTKLKGPITWAISCHVTAWTC